MEGCILIKVFLILLTLFSLPCIKCSAELNSHALHEAIVKGDVESVQRIVENECNVDSKDYLMQTILHMAVKTGHSKILYILLNANADPDSRDQSLRTPLHIAAGIGSIKEVDMLLMYGADIEAKDKWGRTPLHEASERYKPKLIRHLLEKGAYINSKDNNGNTALHVVSCSNITETLQVLLDSGSDTLRTNNEGRTALAKTAICGQFDFFKILYGFPHSRNFKDNFGNTLLHAAVMGGSLRIVEYLISANFNVDALNKEFQTPLHIASDLGFYDLVRLLVINGAAINIPDRQRNSPLHFAVASKDMRIFYFLLESGGDVYLENVDSRCPLDLLMVKPGFEMFAQSLKEPLNIMVKDDSLVNIESYNLIRDAILSNDRNKISEIVENHFRATNKSFDSTKLMNLIFQSCCLLSEKISNEKSQNIISYISGEYNCGFSDKVVKSELNMNCSSDSLAMFVTFGGNINVRDCDGSTPLHIAAYKDNSNIIDILISQNISLEIRDKYGRTPLFIAAQYGSINALKSLIQKKANIHASGWKNKFSPIHVASEYGQIQAIELLLAAGANIEQKSTCYERRPLHQAAFHNQTKALEVLISKGADVNEPDLHGRTSLHLASQKGHYLVAEILLKENAVVSPEMRDQITPLITAAVNGHLNLAMLLLKYGANVKEKTVDKRTMLHLASYGGSVELVKEILKMYPEAVNMTDFVGKTPLYWSTSCGCVEVFEVLIKSGANPNSKTNRNSTILHGAVEGGDLRTTRAAVKYVDNINALDSDGESALFKSANFANRDIFIFLLKNNAETKTVTKYNETVLHAAAHGGDEQITKMLLEMKVDIDAQDNNGETPLYRAAINGRYEAFQLLLDRGADPNIPNNRGNTMLHWAAHSGSLTIVEKVFTNHTNIEQRDRRGRTPLYIAAEDGRIEVFMFLISKGANWNITTEDGKSLLHAATEGGEFDIVSYVANVSKHINAQDKNGRTALFIAAEKPSKRLVDVLLKLGADINIKANCGQTLLHAAASGGDIDIIKKLALANHLNVLDTSGKSALFYAAENSRNAAFKHLLAMGSGIAPTHGGWTILHSAANGDDLEILNLAMKLTKDINAQDKEGRTPLYVSVENEKLNSRNIFRTLMARKADPDIPKQNNYTILHWACHYGDAFITLQVLRRSRKTLDMQDYVGRTPLHWAVYYEHYAIIKQLIRFNADAEKENVYGYNPLMIVATKGSVRTMKEFAKYDYSGEAMLGIALASGNRDVMNYLLQDRVIITEETRLYFAAARGDNAELKRLCTSKPAKKGYKFQDIMTEISKEYLRFTRVMDDDDVYIINPLNFRQTPLDMAVFFKGTIETAELLLNCTNSTVVDLIKNRKRWTPLDMAAFAGKEDMVKYFIKIGIPTNYTGDDLWSPMHKAAWGGHSSLVRLLYANDADINQKDQMGRTPMHIAAMRGYNITVNEIIQLSNATINMGDRYHFSPLHVAEIYGHQRFFEGLGFATMTMDPQIRYNMVDLGFSTSARQNHSRTIELLLENGADPNKKDKVFGWTVLHWASAIGHLKVVEILVKHGAKVNIPSRLDQTPMYLARFWGRGKVYDFLKQNGGVW